ncbi:trypsin-like serine peptidase [Mucilaginibacter jinjuensis]|uniref:Serine protease n=1 Tax=Mucilaginibacter jinjuensis TaxID=1176721 RepID=A0ABY7TAU2_9SPHI|nr:serine protease [Mucilaginibacter jinjuensis]WCT13625.1 serine protease [Mucilaginibacter jinjuensis]
MDGSVVAIWEFDESRDRIDFAKEACLGVGLLVANDIILTCTHVVTSQNGGVIKNVTVVFPLLGGNFKTIEVKGEYIDHTEVSGTDIIIFRLKEIDSKLNNEIKPAILSTDVPQGSAVWAYGYPRERSIEGINAKGIVFGKTGRGLGQIQGDTQYGYFVRPGFSGGGVYDKGANVFYGIFTESDANEETRLAYFTLAETIGQKWPQYIKLKWPQPIRQFSILKNYNEAFMCDRVEFSDNFREYYDSNKHTIQNYLIVGEQPNSTVGLARKLIYENFIKEKHESQYKYPLDLNLNIKHSDNEGIIQIRENTTFTRFVTKIVEVLGLENENTKDYNTYQHLDNIIAELKKGKPSLLFFEIAYGNGRIDKILSVFKEFTDLVNTQNTGTNKVLFFWCVSYPPSMFKKEAFIIHQFLKVFNSTSNKISVINSLAYFIPFVSKYKLKKILTTIGTENSGNIFPVNKELVLKVPPIEDRSTWMNRLETDCKHYKVPFTIDANYKQTVLDEKRATEIERIFVNILIDYKNIVEQHP